MGGSMISAAMVDTRRLDPEPGDGALHRAPWRQAWLRQFEQAWQNDSGAVPSHTAPDAKVQLPAEDPALVMGTGTGEQRCIPEAAVPRLSAPPHRAPAASPVDVDGQAMQAPLLLTRRQVGESWAYPWFSAPSSRELRTEHTSRALADESAETRLLRAAHDILPRRNCTVLPDGEGVAVWLRDATLTPARCDSLVERLRHVARDAAVVLRRVVVNGETVFEAEHAAPEGVAQRRSY